MSVTMREEYLTRLEDARQLVARRARPDGEYDGWSGKDILTHLAAYARLIVRCCARPCDASLIRSFGRSSPPSLPSYARRR